jgi:hypothetical protein
MADWDLTDTNSAFGQPPKRRCVSCSFFNGPGRIFVSQQGILPTKGFCEGSCCCTEPQKVGPVTPCPECVPAISIQGFELLIYRYHVVFGDRRLIALMNVDPHEVRKCRR